MVSVRLNGRVLRAVIFDMDGLIFDSERVAQKAWSQAIREFGYDLSDEGFKVLVGRSLPFVRAELLATFGEDLDFEAAYQRKGELVEAHLARHGLSLKPGVLELLDKLDRLGLRRAIASSSYCPVIERNLEVSGLSPDRFDALVGGEEVANGKPAPDIFLLAAETLGVRAEDCLVLEDSNAGVQAAHAAGMLPVMVPDLVPPNERSRALAFRVLPSLHAVRELIIA